MQSNVEIVTCLVLMNLRFMEMKDTCSVPGDFPELSQSVYFKFSSFKVLKSISILICVKNCQLRTSCESFNFNRTTSDCELLSTTAAASNTALTSDSKMFYSEISAWPIKLAGDCSRHTCPDETYCVIDKPGQTSCQTETWTMVEDTTTTTSTTTVPTTTMSTTTVPTTTTAVYQFIENSITLEDGSIIIVNELVVSQTLTLAEVEDLIINNGACVSDCSNLAGGTYQSCVGCYQYVSCSNGLLINQPCNSGLKWDQKIRNCNFVSATCNY